MYLVEDSPFTYGLYKDAWRYSVLDFITVLYDASLLVDEWFNIQKCLWIYKHLYMVYFYWNVIFKLGNMKGYKAGDQVVFKHFIVSKPLVTREVLII